MRPWTWEHDIPDHCFLLCFTLVADERIQRWIELRTLTDFPALQRLVDRPERERSLDDWRQLRDGVEAIIAACVRHGDRASPTWSWIEEARRKHTRAFSARDLLELGFVVDWVERDLLGLVDPRGSSPHAPFGFAITVDWFPTWLGAALDDGPSLIPIGAFSQVVAARTYGASSYAWLQSEQVAWLARQPIRSLSYDSLFTPGSMSVPSRTVFTEQSAWFAEHLTAMQDLFRRHTGCGYVGWFTRNLMATE